MAGVGTGRDGQGRHQIHPFCGAGVMGKVRDETAAKPSKPAPKSASAKEGRRRVVSFLANLVRTDVVKPNQGKNARLWTAIGLGVLVAAGIYRLYEQQLKGEYGPAVRFGVPAALLAALGWVVFRVVQYPPFVDFLIATEAEMNKVSWTSKADLYRATTVVLVTVLVIAVYLFGVDWLWSWLLKMIGVLRFEDSSGLGSNA